MTQFSRHFTPIFLLGLTLSFVPIFFHIILYILPVATHLPVSDVDTTTTTEWLGFTQQLKFTYIFYLALPFVCTLGWNLLVFDEIRSGFLITTVFYRSIRSYWLNRLSISFLSGFLIVTFPLLTDLLASFTFLPLLQPDWMINQLLALPKLTYFHMLFYTHPIYLILLYILMGGILGGLCAMLSAGAALFFTRRLVIISLPLAICLFFAILATLFPQLFFDPATIVIAFSPNYLPPIQYPLIVTLLTVWVIYISGIARIKKIVS